MHPGSPASSRLPRALPSRACIPYPDPKRSEARAGFSYPKSGVSSFCASMFGKKYCVDYPKVIMAYTSVKIPLPNEHIIWVRKHAGLQKALVALNKALDPAYKLKLDPSGMC